MMINNRFLLTFFMSKACTRTITQHYIRKRRDKFWSSLNSNSSTIRIGFQQEQTQSITLQYTKPPIQIKVQMHKPMPIYNLTEIHAKLLGIIKLTISKSSNRFQIQPFVGMPMLAINNRLALKSA